MLTHLKQGENEEGSASTGLYDDGNKLGVDSAEGAVPGDTRDPDVIVALVILKRLAKDVTELACPHHSPDHVCNRPQKRERKKNLVRGKRKKPYLRT